jgi:hypothetical protein
MNRPEKTSLPKAHFSICFKSSWIQKAQKLWVQINYMYSVCILYFFCNVKKFNTLPNYLKIVETSFILIPFNGVLYDFCDTGIFTLALHEYESGIRKNISLSIIEIEPVQDIIFTVLKKNLRHYNKFFNIYMYHSKTINKVYCTRYYGHKGIENWFKSYTRKYWYNVYTSRLTLKCCIVISTPNKGNIFPLILVNFPIILISLSIR